MSDKDMMLYGGLAIAALLVLNKKHAAPASQPAPTDRPKREMKPLNKGSSWTLNVPDWLVPAK